jgi:leucyl-tRNA synthetase
VDSSWYFLRFLSPDREDVAWNPELTKSWLPVDQYIGGAEHSVMHLLYARFIIKALYDAGLVSFDEPFARLRHQGIITHKGDKMSKSRGNVVNPDAFVDKYGSDVFRMYMMFMGDYEQGGDWSDEGITGIVRFVNRLWVFYRDHANQPSQGEPSGHLRYALHYAIQHVTQDLGDLHFNTALSRMMELLNVLSQATPMGHDSAAKESPTGSGIPGLNTILETFARLVAPFAPHMGEELWHTVRKDVPAEVSVFDQPWPEFDSAALVRDSVTLVVQINGKLRDKLEVPPDINQESVVFLAKASERLAPYLEGKQIRKVIFVPGKLLNLVVG